MKVRYIYSACVTIETPDVTICCDPWFTQGAELGSWYHYPMLKEDPVAVIGKVDVIYISHIHNDHYDISFLRRYLKKYPDVRIVIGEFKPDLLQKRMVSDGIKFEVISSLKIGRTSLSIFVNHFYSWDVDSALVVSHGSQSVVNLNDNQFDPEQVAEILRVCPNGRPNLALLPYVGAGPYPQTYHFDDPRERDAEAEKKKQKFLRAYERYIDELKPDFAMPFAGKYVLAGPLARLNPYRGAADQTEVLRLEQKYASKSFVLADGGHAYFDLDTGKASAVRTTPYDEKEAARAIASYPFEGYDYELEFMPKGNKPIPLVSLCKIAYEKSISGSKATEPWWICLKPPAFGKYIVFNVQENSGVNVLDSVDHLEPRWEIAIDDRLLFLILARYHNWNSAEAGSLFQSKRVPNRFVRSVQDFLYFFMV